MFPIGSTIPRDAESFRTALAEGLAVSVEEVAVDAVDHAGVGVTEDLGEHPGVAPAAMKSDAAVWPR